MNIAEVGPVPPTECGICGRELSGRDCRPCWDEAFQAWEEEERARELAEAFRY